MTMTVMTTTTIIDDDDDDDDYDDDDDELMTVGTQFLSVMLVRLERV